MTREEHILNLETIGCDGWTVTTEAKKSLEWAISKLKENKGEWLKIYPDHEEWNVYECSHCGEEFDLIEGTPYDNGYNFCPNCGADMRGE